MPSAGLGVRESRSYLSRLSIKNVRVAGFDDFPRGPGPELPLARKGGEQSSNGTAKAIGRRITERVCQEPGVVCRKLAHSLARKWPRSQHPAQRFGPSGGVPGEVVPSPVVLGSCRPLTVP